MSTVSAGFTVAAEAFCKGLDVGYVNYPLTGGPLGAQLGGGHPNGMLILASGDQETLQPPGTDPRSPGAPPKLRCLRLGWR